MARFAVYPGDVVSRNDRQRHYIGPWQLMHLYGVRRDECLVAYPRDFGDPSQREFVEECAKLPGLPPRYRGNYLNTDGTPNADPPKKP